MNLDLVPRSCKYAVNQVVWRIRIPKLSLDLVPKSCKKHSRPGSLEDQDPKSKISKINFALWIRRFCRHLSHYSFCRIRIRTVNLDLVPRSCKFAVKQLVWRIRIPKLKLDLVPKSCKFAVNQLVWRIRIPKLNLDLVPKSCKNTQNQVAWRIRIR